MKIDDGDVLKPGCRRFKESSWSVSVAGSCDISSSEDFNFVELVNYEINVNHFRRILNAI